MSIRKFWRAGSLAIGLLALAGQGPAAAQGGADLVITKVEQAPSPAKTGALLTYKVTFSNAGPGTAEDVILFTEHSSGFEWHNNRVTQADGSPAPGTGIFSPGAPFNKLELHVDSLPAGQSLIFYVDVKPQTTGTFSFTAHLHPSEGDPNPQNNVAGVQTEVQKGGKGGKQKPPPPEIGVFGVATSHTGTPLPSIEVPPGTTVYGFLALKAAAGKNASVEVFLQGAGKPFLKTTIKKGVLHPTGTSKLPYPLPIPIGQATQDTVIVVRATLKGQSTSDPRYSRTVAIRVHVPGSDLLVTGPSAGAQPVRFFDDAGGVTGAATPFGTGFAGGVRVAVGDVNGDGRADLVSGAGPGAGPHVKVVSGENGADLASFMAFPNSFQGGVYVAAGDVNADGRADIIAAAGPGTGVGSHVKVFSGRDLSVLHSFFAYGAAFSGGVTVAAGDVNGDGYADIVTGAASEAPHVKVFSGQNLAELRSFLAFEGFLGGVYVAAGDVDGDGRADLVTTPTSDAGPLVKVFNGQNLAEIASFFAFDASFRGGVTVAAGDLDGDGRAEIIAGAASHGPAVRIFRGTNQSLAGVFLAYEAFSGGVYVAAGH